MHMSHGVSWKKATGQKGPSVNAIETLKCPKCGQLLTFEGYRSRKSIIDTHLLDEKNCQCCNCEYIGPGFLVVYLEVRDVAGYPWADTFHYLETGEIVEAV